MIDILALNKLICELEKQIKKEQTDLTTKETNQEETQRRGTNTWQGEK